MSTCLLQSDARRIPLPSGRVTEDKWQGCYREGWGDFIVSEAYAHPAKVSYSLAERIYAHAFAEGWLTPGSVVLDPFSGIGGLGLHAMLRGCHWIGCELEQKFVDLGRENIALWQQRYRNLPGLGSAVILQGDSRRLREVLAEPVEMVCSSPPYIDSSIKNEANYEQEKIEAAKHQGKTAQRATWGFNKGSAGQDGYGQTPGQLGQMKEDSLTAMISSPPYASGTVHDGNGIDPSKLTGNPAGKHSQAFAQGYGKAEGQLAAMTEGNLDCLITSPPFAAAQTDGGLALPDATYQGDGQVFGKNHGYQNQGTTPGNLAALPEGGIEAVVSSPPWEASAATGTLRDSLRQELAQNGHKPSASGESARYGASEHQIGNSTGSTFWSASREILSEVFALLKPGGDPVIDDENIEFCACRH